MAFSAALQAVQYYTQLDVYYYTVDNRPLVDLAARDVQLANELDRRVIAVDITGASTPTINKAPSGWTCTANGTGDYTITHNLADANYVVVGTVRNATVGICFVVTQDANTINIKTTNSSGTATHMRFSLIVSRY